MNALSFEAALGAVMGSALAQFEPIEPAPEIRARMRAGLVARAHSEARSVSARSGDQAFFTIRAAEGKWHDIHPGVKLKLLLRDETTQTFLLDIAPSTIVPSHDHPSDEECFVMRGEALIGEVRLRAGDYHFAAQGSHHSGLRTDTGAMLFIKTGAKGPRIHTPVKGSSG
jgi:quercetin dioxygenase-like cupin family protein